MACSLGCVTGRPSHAPRLLSLVLSFSWLSGGGCGVASAFVAPASFICRHAAQPHGASAGQSTVVAGRRCQSALLGVTSGAATAVKEEGGEISSVAVSDAGLGGVLSGREAVELAAAKLVPLFAEVDAHTQR